jgi:hypothetical protein
MSQRNGQNRGIGRQHAGKQPCANRLQMDQPSLDRRQAMIDASQFALNLFFVCHVRLHFGEAFFSPSIRLMGEDHSACS